MRAKITGTGLAVPKRVVTNDDLSKMMDTSDEWIRQRSGIEQRHWVSEGETPASLAHEATLAALDQCGLEPGDLDCILLATLSPEHDFPGTSFFLHERLDLDDTPCIDLRAQCSGFLYALSFADSLVLSGKYRRVLVVGAEVHSTGLDKTTRGRDVAVLFGDGAGAVVVEANDDESDSAGILHAALHAEGRHARRLWLEYPSSAQVPDRLPQSAVDEGRVYPSMEGRFVFKHAVTRMPEVLREALDASSVKLEDVDLFLFHQANLRINEYVAGQLEIPPEKIFNNIQRYGNCSAGSIPMLLAECTRNGMLAPGKLVCMTGFGSGFTWASVVVRW
jgi:3-oxoacyl-[acyl-carrier-protein] synthase-3